MPSEISPSISSLILHGNHLRISSRILSGNPSEIILMLYPGILLGFHHEFLSKFFPRWSFCRDYFNRNSGILSFYLLLQIRAQLTINSKKNSTMWTSETSTREYESIKTVECRHNYIYWIAQKLRTTILKNSSHSSRTLCRKQYQQQQNTLQSASQKPHYSLFPFPTR